MRRIAATLAAAAAAGSPLAAAPPLAAWQDQVAHIIATRQSYPRSAELRGEQGTTRLRVALTATGRVAGIDLVKSSGSAILDLEARTTMANIRQLPPPPSGVTSLTVPFVWRLN